jgi:hypothetical protein
MTPLLKNSMAALALLCAPAAPPCRAADDGPAQPAPAVAVARGDDGALYVSGADCGLLGRQAAALAAWRRDLREAAAPPEACACADGACSLKITGAAPDLVNAMHGVKAGRWGPNCWNTALVADKILSAPSFTSPEEMSFWMASPVCRALAAGEAPRPGDIIAIRGQAGDEVHGFIYLTPELSFSKNYLTAAAPYALQSPEDVYAEFPVAPDCRLPGSGAACAARSDYFRCSTLQDYLASANIPQDQEYAKAAAAVAGAEKDLSDLVLRWKIDPDLKARAPEILAASQAALLPVKAQAAGRPGLLWQALSLRVDSLLHQISLI